LEAVSLPLSTQCRRGPK